MSRLGSRILLNSSRRFDALVSPFKNSKRYSRWLLLCANRLDLLTPRVKEPAYYISCTDTSIEILEYIKNNINEKYQVKIHSSILCEESNIRTE
ncbi:hypothetical protein PUN28_004567 [Cardiocondyla obscurior]|uniref:Uncharacterized protein n=1 Tax=Cardiocondyla obscurior TaxID=286306 RepID=A0AAW2GEF8_9HYME